MDATRSRGRGRFFSCFRPFVVGDDDVDDGAVTDSSSCRSSPGDAGVTKRKRRLRRSFSAALKAVIFRTALLKKSKSETRYDHDNDGSRSNFLSCRGKSFVKSNGKNVSSKPPFLVPDGVLWSNSNRSPYFSSDASSRTPSTLSSLSVSSRSSPARSEYDNIQRCMSIDHFRPMMKHKTMRKCGYSIPALEICVILVCLAALIWGKAFAIVACTSAWLFFAPSGVGGRQSRRLRRADSYEAGDSEEYKKRVIMEGLLERDRSRVFQY